MVKLSERMGALAVYMLPNCCSRLLRNVL